MRCGSATASARTWPAFTFCNSVWTLLNPSCTSPLIKASDAGPVPLYGTCSIFTPVASENSSMAR